MLNSEIDALSWEDWVKLWLMVYDNTHKRGYVTGQAPPGYFPPGADRQVGEGEYCRLRDGPWDRRRIDKRLDDGTYDMNAPTGNPVCTRRGVGRSGSYVDPAEIAKEKVAIAAKKASEAAALKIMQETAKRATDIMMQARNVIEQHAKDRKEGKK
jgi:hypothetical protein